jgi:predicted transposase YdaD
MGEEDKAPHDIYDRGYKMLLSFTKIFQQLMEGYVEGDWKSRLDYAKSQRIDKTFILKELEKEEADILYKVPILGEDKEIMLYVLIEQQSTVDYSLAFRVLAYLVDVWRDIYKNIDKNLRRQKGFRLPPVFPIILYNGDESWTSALSVRDLVEHGEIFGNFIPNVLYHLIDIPRCDPAKLTQIGNSLAGVFLLEHENEEGDFETILQKSLDIIDQESDYDLWRSIVEWVIAKLRRELPQQAGTMLDGVDFNQHSRKEIKSMLETMPKKLMALGEQKGRREGVKESIVKFLQARFGKLPQELKEQLNAVSSGESLDGLLERTANVKSLAEFQASLVKVMQKK